MSNFIHGGFTDLNALTNIDADEIRTNALYVNGILIEPNSNIFDVITCSQLICQYDISANTIHAVTSIQGVPVSKFAFFTNVSSDIQDQFNSIANTYCLQSDYLTLKTQADSTKNILTGASFNQEYQFIDFSYNMHVYGVLYANYENDVLDVTAILYGLPTTYVSISNLAYELSNYITFTEFETTLNNYCLQSDYLTLKTQTDGLSLKLTNTEYVSSVNFLNFYNNVNVFGTFFVTANGNNFLDVKAILLSLPSTYVSYTYLGQALSNYVTNSTLSSYATNSSVDTKISNLQTQITDNKAQTDANSVVIATNATSIAALVIASASQQTQITGLAATVGGVQAGLFAAQQDITTLQENTEYITVGGIQTRYTQFAGDGIKMMNGVGYSVIINVNGDSQFYGLVSLLQGLSVTNGIITDRITISDDLDNTGQTTLADTTINGTLGVTGISTLNATNLATGNLTLTTGNVIVTAGKIEINAGLNSPPNYFGNPSIFNAPITGSNIGANNITSAELITAYDITSSHNITAYDINVNNNLNVANEITALTITSTNISATNITCNNNLSATNINCNNLNFINSLGGHNMLIGTNGGGFLNGNSITIGNAYSVTYLGGIVAFTGAVFNISNFINQIGV